MWFELTVLYSCFITVLPSIYCILSIYCIFVILKCIFHGICDLVTVCRMGNGVGDIEATCHRPRRGTCTRYMFDKYGPDSVRDVANWCVWSMNSKLPFPENGTFDRDCLNHLRKKFWRRMERTRRPRGTYIGEHTWIGWRSVETGSKRRGC